MQFIEGILATTHRDLHNERFTKEALESMVKQINNQYIPMGIEHDPRIAPQGRMVSARLEETEDGEYRVVYVAESYSEGLPSQSEAHRGIPLRPYNENLSIAPDRTYRFDEDQEILKELSDRFFAQLEFDGKKSVEPLSVLIFTLGVVSGKIFEGFFNQLGSDSYEFLKSKLKALLKTKRDSDTEHLIIFRSIIKKENYFVEVDTILTNPTDSEISELLNQGLKHLDMVVPGLLEQNEDLRRYVFEFEGTELTLKFSVRKDAIPYFPKAPIKIQISPPPSS